MPGSLLGLPLVVPSGSLAASLAVFNAALEATAASKGVRPPLGLVPGGAIPVRSAPLPACTSLHGGGKAASSISEMTAVAWVVMQPRRRHTSVKAVHDGGRTPGAALATAGA